MSQDAAKQAGPQVIHQWSAALLKLLSIEGLG